MGKSFASVPGPKAQSALIPVVHSVNRSSTLLSLRPVGLLGHSPGDRLIKASPHENQEICLG